MIRRIPRHPPSFFRLLREEIDRLVKWWPDERAKVKSMTTYYTSEEPSGWPVNLPLTKDGGFCLHPNRLFNVSKAPDINSFEFVSVPKESTRAP